MYSLIWLADVLRNAGLKVVEEPGWKDAGRAEFGKPLGVLIHHTGAGESHELLALVKKGREDLAGPLCQLFLDRDGTYHIVAAGRANHAGAGQWHGVTDGNGHLIGIEAANAGDGSEPWPQVQLAALTLGTAALLEHMGADAVMAAGHKEYALPRGRKVDPNFDMVAFRQQLDSVMGGPLLPAPAPIVITDVERSMLRKGDQGQSVRELQKLLGITVDGAFGPATDSAVRAYQTRHGLKPDGLVGPATWKALGH